MIPTTRLIAILAALVVTAGCGRSAGESPGAAPSSSAATTESAPSSSVARIVFVDQEQACDCTMTRIETSWAALQAVVGEGSGVPVERVHRDTQEQQADQYRLLRPMVTVPGIYLLDESGAVVELLQGEVTEEQLRRALAGGTRGGA